MKIDWTKHKHLVFDLIIGLLFVVLAILIDVFIVSLRSKVADDFVKNFPQVEEFETSQELINFTELKDVKPGERLFIPILNFHQIGEAPAKASQVAKSFYLEPAEFETDIKGLVAEGYKPLFISQIVSMLLNGKVPPAKTIALTFDDGNFNFYTTAWPILKKYNLRSSIYVMTGVKGDKYITKEQMQELDSSGMVEIGSHTVWHPYLTRISKEEQLKELHDSKVFLESLLDKPVDVICYPFGLYDDNVIDSAQQAGYKAGLTFDQDAWQDPQNLFLLKRISIYPNLNIVKFLAKLKSEN